MFGVALGDAEGCRDENVGDATKAEVDVAEERAGAAPVAAPVDWETAVSEKANRMLRTRARIFIDDYFSALNVKLFRLLKRKQRLHC